MILKKHWYSNFPKWLKLLLFFISIITMVYWVGLVTYKILCAIRIVGSFIFEKRNYWTFLCCIAILIIGSFIMAQFVLGLDPYGKIVEELNKFWDTIIIKLNEIII